MVPTKLQIVVSMAVVRAREAVCWTQTEASKRLKIPQPDLARIESALLLPDFPLAVRLCETLHIDPASFYDCVEDEKFEEANNREARHVYRYLPMRTLRFHPNLDRYITFGILAEVHTGQAWRAVMTVPDVSCDAGLVWQLTDRCTKGQLHPRQLSEVVINELP